MKFWDFLQIADISWDIADDKYDTTICVVWGFNEYKENIDKYSNELYLMTEVEVYKRVNLIRVFDGTYASAVCDWHSIVEDNIELWKAYTNKTWSEDYRNLYEEDYDEYVYQCIHEIEVALQQGWNDEDFYNLIKSCKI